MTNQPQKDWARGNPIFDEAAEICTQLVVEEIAVGEGVKRIKQLLYKTCKEAIESCVQKLKEFQKNE